MKILTNFNSTDKNNGAHYIFLEQFFKTVLEQPSPKILKML